MKTGLAWRHWLCHMQFVHFMSFSSKKVSITLKISWDMAFPGMGLQNNISSIILVSATYRTYSIKWASLATSAASSTCKANFEYAVQKLTDRKDLQIYHWFFCVGAERGGKEPSPLYFTPQRCQVRERGEGRVKPPKSINKGVFNVRGCSTNEAKKGEISKMFLRQRFDVCALSETKLNGIDEVMFGEVVGRVSGVAVGIRYNWKLFLFPVRCSCQCISL